MHVLLSISPTWLTVSLCVSVAQAVKWHPDKNPNQKEAAEERFKQVAGESPAI